MCRIATRFPNILHHAHEGAHRAGEPLDVRAEWRIELPMRESVLTHNVDDWRSRAPRVVEIRQAVGESRSQMQQRRRRDSGHARVAIRRSGRNPFEQAGHGPHPRNPIERSNEVHLRGARIGEAGIDAGGHEAAHERLGAGHTVVIDDCRPHFHLQRLHCCPRHVGGHAGS